MSTLLLGLLMALLMLQMFRLNSWVVSSAVMMLLVSITLSVTTDFNAVNLNISILILLTAVVLMQQPNLRFGDLLALNFLLLLHVLAAYLSVTTTLIVLALYVIINVITSLIKNKSWLGWLIILGMSLWCVAFGSNHYWLSAALVFTFILLKKLANYQTIETPDQIESHALTEKN